jgi:hypothetical protein
MKRITLIISTLFMSYICYSQVVIDSSNYFEFYSERAHYPISTIHTKFLQEEEVAPIIADEMRQTGFEWINLFQIVELDSNRYVLSTCYSEKSKFGFLYEGSHGMIPIKGNKQLISLYKKDTGNDYAEKIVTLNGKSRFIKYKELPKNFFIIKQECYWYQTIDFPDSNENLVSRELITSILRQDIRRILEKQK